VAGRSLDWYDYGARFYEPEIGRWQVIDPLAEQLPNWTSYRYGLDNPMKYTDINGQIEWPLVGNSAVNKRDYNNGGWGLKNTIVRVSTYREIRNIGTSPHIGIDYRASSGTSFYSLGDGVVTKIGTMSNGIKYISVRYSNGDVVRFLHITGVAEGIKKGQQVYEGQILGETGNTGTYKNAKGKYVNYDAHLHIDATNADGEPIDPEDQNYGTVTNDEFFSIFGGDYQKLLEYKKNKANASVNSARNQKQSADATRVSASNTNSDFINLLNSLPAGNYKFVDGKLVSY